MRAGSKGKHASPRAWWAQWWVITAGAIVLVGGVAAAIAALVDGNGSGASQVQARGSAQARAVSRAAAEQAAQAQLLAGLSVTPAQGSTGVSLDAVVSVKAAVGVLSQVKVAAASGAELAGTEQPGSNEWSSVAQPLLPSTTYTVTAQLSGQGGVTAQQISTFTTLTPVVQVTASVFPTPDMTVGVGQPLVVTFNHDITGPGAQLAAESHFTIAESQPVPGGWYWFSPHELHFRPQTYWPAHEQIKVTADLAGWDAGQGRWGTGQVADTFSIGDARISYANLSSEQMRVTLNGATIATYPISGGRPKYPTMNGDHLVLDRESVVHMVSSSVGIPVNSPDGYDEYVYDDVHISDSGEYVHAAPWSVGAQGVTNVSHGCINLSPANALNFFNLSRVGDVVQVTGGPRPPVPGDHGVMDWLTPWSQFTPGTVVPLNGAPAAPPTSGSGSTPVPSGQAATTTTTKPAVATATG